MLKMITQTIHVCEVCENKDAFYSCIFCDNHYCREHSEYYLNSYFYEWMNGAKVEICNLCKIKEENKEIIQRLELMNFYMKQREILYEELVKKAKSLNTVDWYHKEREKINAKREEANRQIQAH